MDELERIQGLKFWMFVRWTKLNQPISVSKWLDSIPDSWSLDTLSAAMTDVFILSQLKNVQTWQDNRQIGGNNLRSQLHCSQHIHKHFHLTLNSIINPPTCHCLIVLQVATWQGGLWADTAGLSVTNCPHLPAALLSEVSHIHRSFVLLKAEERRNDLARNSSVTWVCAVTSQPAAQPYMEPCPILTIKCK